MPPTVPGARAAAAACSACALLLALPAQAQPAPSAPSAPSAAASAPARPAAAPPGQRVEVTGGRESDTEQRRQSTAAKIVIGRDEIDKFGDATLGEVLRRLPGVTTPGAPGRGGPPRMRGLGGGYTQLLIDGQRLPPGFSLESLSPEQVERIEILRAPTAETGARAIAGTINIVTREGFKRRLNDLRLGFGYEDGRFTPGLSWTHNESIDNFIYNLSASVFRPHRLTEGRARTVTTDASTGAVLEDQQATSHSDDKRTGVALTARLQWRLNDSGDQLMLMPTLFANRFRTAREFTLVQPVSTTAPLYDTATSATEGNFRNLRLNANWRQRVFGVARLELNGNVGQWRSQSDTDRDEFASGTPPTLLRHLDDTATTRERSFNLTTKLSALAGGNPDQPGREHSLVGGLELEGVRRTEQRVQLDNGRVIAAEFGDTFSARTLRAAVYLQDEWAVNPNWSLHAGLRGEGIRTEGDAGPSGTDPRPRNTATVWTPLVHVLWKPDPKKRDQVRLSLTRSYKSPTTQQLIARPSVNQRTQPAGSNTPVTADSAGNPNLQPELARGIDLAFERYLDGGGVLSANLFHRAIQDLQRNVLEFETVSYSAFPRWVSRPRNIGDAITQGIELEAKYRLDQLVAGTPPVELRHNLSLFRSRVDGVPGPDNRLDQQAKVIANLGADYRLRGTPLTLGGNVNWVPGYRTQLADDRSVTVSGKRVFDAFALWTFSPAAGLRLMASNLGPRDYETVSTFDYTSGGTPLRETATAVAPNSTNWQLRLELKL